MTEECVVLVAVPSRSLGEAIAATLVEERLAACINLVGPVRSVYRWEGTIRNEEEHLLFIKTTRARYPDVEARVLALHSYSHPEIVALPIAAGSDAYLRWLRAETGPPDE